MTTQAPDALRLVPEGEGVSPIYQMAYDSIRKGAPGLSDATCAVIARQINMKVALSAPAVQPAAGREVYNAIVTLQAFLDDFDNENLDAIEADDFNIGQDEYIEVPSATLRRVLTALAHPPAQVSGGEVEGAASALLDACYTADENGDLSDFIDGTLLTRLDRALSARVLAALSAPQAAPGEGEQS